MNAAESHHRGPQPRDPFDPRHIAVVGASDDPSNVGVRFVRGLQRAAFPGRISVVHPSAKRVSGLAAYPDLRACPVPVDHVIVAVSRERALQVVSDAAELGVRTVHIFTGGFGEDVDPRGPEIERLLLSRIRGTSTRLIGPNCMGIHRPSRGLTFRDDLPVRAGPMGIVSQSGGVAIAAIRMADRLGIGTSLALSYGNGADLGLIDTLEYLSRDPETAAVAVYLESANDPRAPEALERASRCKPVVVWQSGVSPRSAWAARRHTGAPGGPLRAGALAAGCLGVDRLEDFVQVAASLCVAPMPQQPGTAFASISGGLCVAFAAMAEREGMRLSSLSLATREKLAQVYRLPAAILENPLDLGGPGYLSRGRLRPLFELLSADPDVGSIAFHLAWDYLREVESRVSGYSEAYLDALIDAAKASSVPVLVDFPRVDDDPTDPPARRRLWSAGLPVYEQAEQIARVTRPSTTRG